MELRWASNPDVHILHCVQKCISKQAMQMRKVNFCIFSKSISILYFGSYRDDNDVKVKKDIKA